MEESFWKQTYEKILIGMGLFGITLNFLFLNQILPFLGALLLFTGFRKLRLEKRWLKAGDAGASSSKLYYHREHCDWKCARTGENLCFICMESDCFLWRNFAGFSDGLSLPWYA